MSGQSPRSWNLPGSFSGFLASSRHSASDPNPVITIGGSVAQLHSYVLNFKGRIWAYLVPPQDRQKGQQNGLGHGSTRRLGRILPGRSV